MVRDRYQSDAEPPSAEEHNKEEVEDQEEPTGGPQVGNPARTKRKRVEKTNAPYPTIRLPHRAVELDVREADLAWALLDRLWRNEREHFDGVVGVVVNRDQTLNQATKERLRRAGLLTQEGSIQPSAKDVLLECYEETANGPRWHDLSSRLSPGDRVALEVFRESAAEELARILSRSARATPG